MTRLWQPLLVVLLVVVATLFVIWRLSPAALRLRALEAMVRLLGHETAAGQFVQRLVDRLRASLVAGGCGNCGANRNTMLK